MDDDVGHKGHLNERTQQETKDELDIPPAIRFVAAKAENLPSVDCRESTFALSGARHRPASHTLTSSGSTGPPCDCPMTIAWLRNNHSNISQLLGEFAQVQQKKTFL